MDIPFETIMNMVKEYEIAMNINLAKSVPTPLLKYKSWHIDIHTMAPENCHINTANAAPNNPILGTRAIVPIKPKEVLKTTIRVKLLGGLIDWIVESQGELISMIAHEPSRTKKISDDS